MKYLYIVGALAQLGLCVVTIYRREFGFALGFFGGMCFAAALAAQTP